jgi:putative N-acetyltransferase (TIGR04045 family)
VSSRASSPAARSRRAIPQCRAVRPGDGLEQHLAVRHAVFVAEQAVFAATDRDDRDGDPGTVHALATLGDVVAGAVRLYPTDDGGAWRGDRLAVLPDHRGGHAGAALVRFAVRTAAARGGLLMRAHIQLPNVRFFTALRWEPDGPVVPYHGIDHQPMVIDLTRLRDR